ncbi:MAG: inositol-3-phosphate synthase [Candidatus Bathyarchaeota archaeon]|nr:inositol-3-phosphate synthase [Candidatus Bathyarchaeota archaeon]MDH5531954.1 inositol-3-phosphate synthase [Candidatus Bathyarchaeota archaeon]MDH5712618.1 inositol-3-phosphate synthase [Candidatus Bathyarchaeota archaeon]
MKIKVAIAGVGNCASALIQGVKYYKDAKEDSEGLGLMHADFGGYHVRDIEFVAAFDVNKLKIGRDLSEAIFARPNCCVKFANMPNLGVKVLPGPILDGVATHMKIPFKAYSEDKDPVDVGDVLEESRADMLLNFLPVGSFHGTRHYAKACLEAGCAFVNCIPEFVVSEQKWAKKFEDAGLSAAGDDIKSQVGATIIHRALVDLLVSRGVKIEKTYQLNVGGNTDFLNMTAENRLETKRISKTEAVKSLVPYDVQTWAGPSGHIPFLKDNKVCHMYIKGRKFGNTPVTIDMKLSVEDSPNSAGMVIDVIRATKLALDRGVGGPLTSISAYAFKHPPDQVPDHIARQRVEEFIQGKRER